MLTIIIVTPENDIFEHTAIGLSFSLVLLSIEILQVYQMGFKEYINDFGNVLDCTGIFSVIFFFSLGKSIGYNASMTLFIIGIVGSFYKGLLFLNCLSPRFRVLIEMVKQTFIDMMPFTVILFTQVFLFVVLSRGDSL